MSAEAVRAVIDQSSAKGPALLVLIMIADQSRDRGSGYYRSEVGYDTIARKARMSVRRAKELVAELIEGNKLKRLEIGGGSTANLYEIPVRRLYGVGVRELAPVVREDPLERTPRADRTDNGTVPPLGELPSNVVRYSVSRKNDRTGTGG